jgi:hypothetical protein
MKRASRKDLQRAQRSLEEAVQKKTMMIVTLYDEHRQRIRVWLAGQGVDTGYFWNFAALPKTDPDNPRVGPFQSDFSAVFSAQAFCDMVAP